MNDDNKKKIVLVMAVAIVLLITIIIVTFGMSKDKPNNKSGLNDKETLNLNPNTPKNQLDKELINYFFNKLDEDDIQYYEDEKNGYVYYCNIIGSDYLAIEKNSMDIDFGAAFLVDLVTKKVVKTEVDEINDSYVPAYRVLEESDDYIGLEHKCLGDCEDYFSEIYTRDLKLISDDFKSYGIDINGNLVISSNGNAYTYDKKGNMIN